MNGPNQDEPISLDVLVATAPFLAGIPRAELDYLFTAGARPKWYRAREYIFQQDDPLEHIYILLSGEIREERKVTTAQDEPRLTLIRVSGEGALIGHYDLFYRKPHSTRARTISDCQVVEIDVGAMNRLLHRYPDIRNKMAPMECINRLRTIPMTAGMNLTMMSFLAEAGAIRPFNDGDVLYHAWEPVENFYIIDKGQVELYWTGQDHLLLGNGMALGFNETGSGRGAPSATFEPDHDAKTTCASTIFVVDRQKFIEITGRAPDAGGTALRAASRETLRELTIFRKFNDELLAKLHGYCSYYQLPVHHVIMQQGEVGDSMWVLMPGSQATLHALDGKGQTLPSIPLDGPSYFGEVALVVQIPMHSSVEARPNSRWLRLNWQDFRLFLRNTNPDLERELIMSAEAQNSLVEEKTRHLYSWLAEGEVPIIFQRRHWIELVRKILPAMGVTLVILILLMLTGVMAQNNLGFRCLYLFLIVLTIGWYIWGILDYRNDYLLVTNQRVVRQEKVIFFNEWQQVAFLEQIQNVDFSTSFVGRLLNYGAMQIQTAGSTGKIVFDYVPDPESIKSVIIQQQGLRQRHYKASSRLVIQRILEDRFGLRPQLPAAVRSSGDVRDNRPAPTNWRERLRERLRIDPHMRKEQADRVIWRKHVIVLLPKLFGPFFLLLVALLIAIAPGVIRLDVFEAGVALELLAGFVGLGALAWWAWVVADWRNDTYEVTPSEIIDTEKKPLFFAEVRRTGRLGQIENIDVSLPTPLHFILNYGNVLLQTAATDGNFTFNSVPDPRGVSEEIRRRIEVYRRQEEEKRAQDRAQELPDWFESYNRLESDIMRDPSEWA